MTVRCVTDVNECAVNNGGCSPFANCTDVDVYYRCTCIEGYNGDGFYCTGCMLLYLIFSFDSCSQSLKAVNYLRRVSLSLIT